MPLITEPNLRTDAPIRITASEAAPTVDRDGTTLLIGRELVRDGGGNVYWNGTAWKPVSETQKLCQVVDLLIEIRDLLTPGD